MRADEFTIEVTRACCALGVDTGYRHADFGALLGREVTNVDTEAYLTWKQALAESMASDREIMRRESESKAKK